MEGARAVDSFGEGEAKKSYGGEVGLVAWNVASGLYMNVAKVG
jgi:hypothetical protein